MFDIFVIIFCFFLVLQFVSIFFFFFFFNDTATTEIYTLHIVGSVRCVQETDAEYRGWLRLFNKNTALCKHESGRIAVSYTHLTLPTICSVQISVVAGSLKKKKKQKREREHSRSYAQAYVISANRD
eukprot:TRINITY_DN5547_c0_g1_i1.p2 TRINITY_DN5547_c0_g1~~TRINITY_DN5547_c0_g1_i1.p2  ORF type:complete len:127 (+),score=28.49 TRINITY_DN5547_c0_g1_i1:61-441(+)